MSRGARFYVDGYLLRVSDSAYLVEVKPANGDTGIYKTPSSLPDWMFRSAHAIWLSEEDAPMIDRALKGETFKKVIMSRSGRSL